MSNLVKLLSVVVIAYAFALGCQTAGTPELPTVTIVAYEGEDSPGSDGMGSGYHLSATSHQLIVNPHFGAVRVETKDDSTRVTVELSPTYRPAAKAFMDASPDNTVTYAIEIERYTPGHLTKVGDPSSLVDICFPLIP
jgi:hypothetical protein